MEISDLEVTAMLLSRYYTIQENEILCIRAKDEKRFFPPPLASILKCKGQMKMSDFSDLQLCPPVFLQPLKPHGCTVSH